MLFRSNNLANYALKSGDTFTGAVNVQATLTTRAIVPEANVTYDIGTLTNRFKDIYLANSTIYIGNTIVTDSNGSVGVALVGQPAVNVATITQVISYANDAYTNAISYTDAKVAAVVNAAPAALDTLIELAEALGNDAHFSTTMLNAVANAYTNATAYADLKAANAYTNALSYADTKAGTAYSNAIAYSGNAALAYANAIAYSGNAAQAYANAIAYSGNAAQAYTNAVAYVGAQSFVSTSQLSSNLAGYVTTTNLTNNLANYVTATNLTNNLANYVTTTNLTNN